MFTIDELNANYFFCSGTAAKNHNDQDLLRMAADVCSAMYYLNESGVIVSSHNF